jgi:hypothetical protein
MKRNKPVLDPYCTRCGSYKGIGFCKNKSCLSYAAEIKWGQSFESKGSCALCRNDASVSCARCGNMYCNTHSENGKESQFAGLNHYIGLCSVCEILVCENCWILNEKGAILCIEHFEDIQR